MCGIAGVVYSEADRPVDHLVLEAMGRAIGHRGPDAQGIWSEPGVGLVHRRLSIIDLAGGDQPIQNEDGSVQVVFNGEIYNYRELRALLEGRGHVFRTRSDTEVLVHLYEEEGAALVARLRGMFAFAIWDRRRKRLLLARDRLGIKPLYVYRDGGMLLFGSELKAILAYPDVPRELDPVAVEDYLAFGIVPGSRSIFRGIEKLRPAHLLEVGHGKLDASPRRYWELRPAPDHRVSLVTWKDEVKSKIEEVVRLHLIADVPVGALLSGGIDSSLLVAECSRRVAAPLRTFSIGFHERAFDELPHARDVARRYGTEHVDEIVTPDAISLIDELTHHFDEPFADASAIPTFLVARLASRSVKVVISGDGGDEAFGGYTRYAHDLAEADMRGRFPAWFRKSALGPLASIWPKADWLPRPLRAKTRLTNLALDPDSAYANTLMLCRNPLRRLLLAHGVASKLDGHDPSWIIRREYSRAGKGEALGGMIAADTAVILPDDFLVKVDRASMAHGLEVRPPLLDHELMELTARMPSSLKVRGGQTKWILRECYRGELPPAILDRPKQGFEVPLDLWLRGPLREMFADLVLGTRSSIGDLLNIKQIGMLARSHRAGLGRHGPLLWAVLVLARWSNRYLHPSSRSLQAA
jgi:asparagine synthase (glutamine-hydrolysing)